MCQLSSNLGALASWNFFTLYIHFFLHLIVTCAVRWMIELSVNIKFEIIWKKAVVAWFREMPQHILKPWITRTYMQSYILEAHPCKHLRSHITLYLFRRMAASKYKIYNNTETNCVTCVSKFIQPTKYSTRSIMCQILANLESTVT